MDDLLASSLLSILLGGLGGLVALGAGVIALAVHEAFAGRRHRFGVRK